MAEPRSYVKPPKSQIPLIQGFKDYVEKHFGSFSFGELRYVLPGTPIYDSIVEMERTLGKLQEEEELGGCCGRLPTGEAIIYLVNKHKRGHKLPSYGLLYEMIHLAKLDLSAGEVEKETSKHFNSALEHARIFAYNTTHKHKKSYPK